MRADIGLYFELAVGEGAVPRLQAALAVAPAKAVLLRPLPGARPDPGVLRPLVELAQARNAAVLVEGDVPLVRTLHADGVHLPWCEDIVEAYAAARRALGEGHIVGAMAGGSRHHAMELGEAGADYIAFACGNAADAATWRELVQWWAELFEVPCVAAGVTSPEEAAELARAGADFIGVPLPVAEPPDSTVRRIRALGAGLAAAHATADTRMGGS